MPWLMRTFGAIVLIGARLVDAGTGDDEADHWLQAHPVQVDELLRRKASETIPAIADYVTDLELFEEDASRDLAKVLSFTELRLRVGRM